MCPTRHAHARQIVHQVLATVEGRAPALDECQGGLIDPESREPRFRGQAGQRFITGRTGVRPSVGLEDRKVDPATIGRALTKMCKVDFHSAIQVERGHHRRRRPRRRALPTAVGRALDRSPLMPRPGRWRQRLVIRNRHVVGLTPAPWADLLVNAAVVAGVGTGSLRFCHDFILSLGKNPGHRNPQ